MKQVLQNYKTGELQLDEVSAPAVKPNTILASTVNSLISVGTERYMLDLAKKSLLGKAMARPDLVKQVISKVRTEGLGESYRQAMGRLDSPVPLGYSASGVVMTVGEGVSGFAEGDRVACAGSGIASHAEINRVPNTLAVKIPDNVSFEEASFVALGAIAMHGVRMASVCFGEQVVVIGLGLLGQLAVQILDAASCRVIGMDLDAERCRLAREHGAVASATSASELKAGIPQLTEGHGADAVLIFAATESNKPVELAAEVAREKGKIVVPGLVGLDLPRKVFYEKELDFVVSRAWGPGMYDPEYEAGKIDYPLSHVRWTAQANMAHFLEMLSQGKVRVDHLITHRFPFDRALEAYDLILKGKEPVIGLVLEYDQRKSESLVVNGYSSDPKTITLTSQKPLTNTPITNNAPTASVGVGLIGAGLFARGTLLPALRNVEGISYRGIAASTGLHAEDVGKKYGFRYCTTDPQEILGDPEIDLVMVLTRHDSHARFVIDALRAGKHIFVEKPLCINEQQLNEIVKTYSSLITDNDLQITSSGAPLLMVGYNRRFAPVTRAAIESFSRIPRPIMVSVRANVGHIPKEAWVHKPDEGGGNIVGEVCHFVDLIQAITGSVPVRVHAQSVNAQDGGVVEQDNVTITLSMADGSVGNIMYTAIGDKAFERERVEIYGGGAACVIHNFKSMTWSQAGKRKRFGHRFKGVDRGHRSELEALVKALKHGSGSPVPFESYVATTRATFAAVESLQTGKPVQVNIP